MKVYNSYLYRPAPAPQTRTVISQKVRVFSYPYGEGGTGPGDFYQVGVMASFDPSDSRGADPVRGIGFGDQIAELVPGVSDPYSLSVSRIALYLSNVFQTFGYKSGADGLVRALKHHKWPFDVNQQIIFSWIAGEHVGDVDGDGLVKPGGMDLQGDNCSNYKAIQTVYEGCWFTSYSTSFSADSAIVTENADISCTDIWDGAIRPLECDKLDALQDRSFLYHGNKRPGYDTGILPPDFAR